LPAAKTRRTAICHASGPAAKERNMYKLLSFDVYGTLVNTPLMNDKVFRTILDAANAPHVDARAFHQLWEQRNITHYVEAYASYKDICRLSLHETFEHFGIRGGDDDLIAYYFSAFQHMELYQDVQPTLKALKGRYRIAAVSNIDDDLFQATPLAIDFDLVCTAERARGYKPDGTLFRYLLTHAGVPMQEILHAGQSQFTDLVGAKPLGLKVAWINRQQLPLNPAVPRPDHILSDVASLTRILDSGHPRA
jgi:2-haloacid dehalogenase